MMQKRRLLKLAKMLDEDAKNSEGLTFDIGVVGQKTFYDYNTMNSKDYRPELSCGTTGCAMGLAALSGEFKSDGLSYRKKNSAFKIETTFNGRMKDYDVAAMLLFGISSDEANWLFSPWKYPVEKRKGAVGERLVARRIRHLVKRGVSKKTLAKWY